MSPRSAEANQQILDKRREQILSAAARVFAARGFAATKISDIAKAAGMSHGLIYHYFKTKDEVFTELFRIATVHRGLSEYIIKQEISPLEKIKKIIEMTLSFGFEGDNFYFWHIANQAYTSESVPEEVKKLIKQNRAQMSGVFIPLIIEGQKLGQIIQDDPLKLDTTLRAALNGLSMQMMRAKYSPEYPFAMPDAEILLRLIMAPGKEISNEPGQAYQRRFGQITFYHKHMTYRIREYRDEDFKLVHGSIIEAEEHGKKIYRIEFERNTGEKCIIRLQANSSRPLSVEVFKPGAKAAARTEFRESSVLFDFPVRNIYKEMKLSGEFYTGYMLFFDFQGFPFESDEVIKYIQVPDGTDGTPMGPFGMEVRKAGREMVTVPAGQFDCYKLEVIPGGVDEYLGGTFKYYYWFTVDEPHVWIKYEDLRGNLRELVTFE